MMRLPFFSLRGRARAPFLLLVAMTACLLTRELTLLPIALMCLYEVRRPSTSRFIR